MLGFLGKIQGPLHTIQGVSDHWVNKTKSTLCLDCNPHFRPYRKQEDYFLLYVLPQKGTFQKARDHFDSLDMDMSKKGLWHIALKVKESQIVFKAANDIGSHSKNMG